MSRSHVPTFPRSPDGDLVTKPQLRYLHALAKQRGLSHEDLHAVCGVPSLKQLSKSAAARAIDRLSQDRPERRKHPYRRGQRPLEPGEIRSSGVAKRRDATNRQRCEIIRLFDLLGWSPAMRERWLKQRHGVDYADVARGIHTIKHPRADLRQGHINRREASLAIRELRRAADKLPPPAPRSRFPVPSSQPEEIPF